MTELDWLGSSVVDDGIVVTELERSSGSAADKVCPTAKTAKPPMRKDLLRRIIDGEYGVDEWHVWRPRSPGLAVGS